MMGPTHVTYYRVRHCWANARLGRKNGHIPDIGFCTNLRSQSAIGIDDQIDVITQQRYSEFGGTTIGHNCKIELLYRLE
jgi:hypothetical protein